jgi:hypothetical protein
MAAQQLPCQQVLTQSSQQQHQLVCRLRQGQLLLLLLLLLLRSAPGQVRRVTSSRGSKKGLLPLPQLQQDSPVV